MAVLDFTPYFLEKGPPNLEKNGAPIFWKNWGVAVVTGYCHTSLILLTIPSEPLLRLGIAPGPAAGVAWRSIPSEPLLRLATPASPAISVVAVISPA